MAKNSVMKLNYADRKDRFFDYRLYEYVPEIPFAGKLRSDNLLFDSFRHEKCPKKFYDLIEAIRRDLGPKNTVWGVQKKGDKLFWELYFYNYKKEKKDVSVSEMTRTVSPFMKCDFAPNENLPYFMFSMDVDRQALKEKKLDSFHLYFMGQSNHSDGFSYRLDKKGVRKENYYSFFFPGRDIKDMVSKIKNSAVVDFSSAGLQEILLPELIQCKQICIANKKDRDCVYYCGVDVDQFIFFLENFGYPEPVVEFVRKNRNNLDHLQYDVGFDYKMGSGKLKIEKSGYYGIF